MDWQSVQIQRSFFQELSTLEISVSYSEMTCCKLGWTDLQLPDPSWKYL
jgi:hypothetical protein